VITKKRFTGTLISNIILLVKRYIFEVGGGEFMWMVKELLSIVTDFNDYTKKDWIDSIKIVSFLLVILFLTGLVERW
jgi:hypothetical protein